VVINSGGGASDAVDLNYDNSGSGLTATNVQDAIDELAVSVGAAYIGNFLIGSWILNVDKYELSIPEVTHSRGLTPMIQVYENNAGTYEEVGAGIEINGSGDIKLIVTSSPDTRFAGRVIIK
jgi:hypothetical protein